MKESIIHDLIIKYFRQCRDNHIDNVENNIYDFNCDINKAKNLLSESNIAFSIYQQYRVSIVMGGIKVGSNIFIECDKLKLLTYRNIHDYINIVLKEVDIKLIYDKLSSRCTRCT